MMQDFFRKSTNWSEVDIKGLSQFRMLEEPNSTDFLVRSGLGKKGESNWYELGAQPMVDGKRIFTKEDGQNSIKSVSLPTSKEWLPSVPTTYRKVGKKYYLEQSALELTDNVPSMKDISDNFDSWMSRMDISPERMELNPISVEPKDLPVTELLEKPPVDVPKDTDEPLSYAEILEKARKGSEAQQTKSGTRQEAITEAKKRRKERRLQRGYVDKLSTSKPPAESATKMRGRTATASEAAGMKGLPRGGGGWRPKKLPPKFRMGGFVPYST
jgi:hypothetical protein